VLYTLITIAGATVIGTQILLYAAAAQFYGLSIRSTGLGWASGIGRNGAIVGPLLGGALLGINLPLQLNFITFAIPGVIAALAMTLFVLSGKRQTAPRQPPATAAPLIAAKVCGAVDPSCAEPGSAHLMPSHCVRQYENPDAGPVMVGRRRRLHCYGDFLRRAAGDPFPGGPGGGSAAGGT